LRRDSPQASRSRHCRAGRPILSPLIPGCSVAGDQGLPGPRSGARCRGGVPNVSSPHRGRYLPRRASGRWILAADGCASTSSDPAYCSCAVWGPGEPRGVAVAMFGHTGLGMLSAEVPRRPLLPHGGHAGSGGNWPSVVLDAEEVLFSQQLIQPGLVDPADEGGFFLAVADAFGQRERRESCR
jgi:hypothetical protein